MKNLDFVDKFFENKTKNNFDFQDPIKTKKFNRTKDYQTIQKDFRNLKFGKKFKNEKGLDFIK